MRTEYNRDYALWVEHQAAFLKNKDFAKLDLKNLIEEVESLARSDKRSIRNHLVNLFCHLLKKQYQSEKLTKSWLKTILNSSEEIREVLIDSPSLKKFTKDEFDYCYRRARLRAALETGLDEKIFPKKCPWAFEELLFEEK